MYRLTILAKKMLLFICPPSRIVFPRMSDEQKIILVWPNELFETNSALKKLIKQA